MAVFVSMTVTPPDPGKFEAAAKASFAEGLPAGAKSQFWGRSEHDGKTYVMGGIWESHDAMHAYSDKVGDAFNRDAGTEGVAWETQVFEVLG